MMKKTKQLTNKQLTKKLDDVFREIMKAKTPKNKFQCFVCKRHVGGFFHPKENPYGLQVGHYITRANFSLRWDFLNCEMICSKCNRAHEEDILPHTKALLDAYGKERIDVLEHKSSEYKKTGKTMSRSQKIELLEKMQEQLSLLTNSK